MRTWESAIRELPSQQHRIAFGAGVSERLLPNYLAFSREVRDGAPQVLQMALDALWQVVQGDHISLGQLRDLQAGCRSATPDPERFASHLTSAAIDAANAIHETLEACYRDDPKRIAEVASYARDTVDMFVQERDQLDYQDPEMEERILRDPLMVRELAKQESELASLAQTKNLDGRFVQTYRAGARYDGKGTLDIG